MADISKTADRALQVLIELGDSGPATPAQLARALGLNRTVVHRLLTTLQARGFVARRDGGYVPGAVVARIAERIEPGLRAASTPVMERLATALDETIIVHIRDGDSAVVLQQVVPTTQLVRVEHRIGSRHSLALGASGRALLAFLEPAFVDRMARHQPNERLLHRQLAEVRSAGYAISHDELQHGVYGLAVPVRGETGGPIASLGVVVPSSRSASLARHTDTMITAAAEVWRRAHDDGASASAADEVAV